MLKVKRPVSSKNYTTEIDEWENDIKTSIKSLYIKNKNDTKLIAQYENALQTLKQEYTLLYKEKDEWKKKFEEYKSQIEKTSENQRKRPLSRFDYENEYNENENVQYIVRKKKNAKKIIYEEEEEETDSEDDEIDGSDKKRISDKIEETIEKKRIKKPNKKGISKSIKM